MGTKFPKNKDEVGILVSFEGGCVVVLQNWEGEEHVYERKKYITKAR